MKVEVIPQRRYISGLKIPGPAFLADTVIGTELSKSEALGWTNAVSYRRGEDELSPSIPGDYTHVIYATRSGPREVIDTDDPKFGGIVVFLKDAYPDMPLVTDPKNPGNVLATDGPGMDTMVAVAGGVVVLGIVGMFFLSNYARL